MQTKPVVEKACPACGETILFVAKKCKHCGEDLSQKANLAAGEVKCTACGAIAVPVKKPKGNLLVALILFLLGGLPGIVYVCVTSGWKYLCPKCQYMHKADMIRAP